MGVAPVGVNAHVAVSRMRREWLSRRQPTPVRWMFSPAVPPARNRSRPEATGSGEGAVPPVRCAPGDNGYQAINAVPASGALNCALNTPPRSSAAILAFRPRGVS